MRKQFLLVCLFALCSCSVTRLETTKVAYQSVNTVKMQPQSLADIPDDATILVTYAISDDGGLTAIVTNKTSEIMIIDQTMSFFVNTNGQSISYYNPTVRTTTTTDYTSSTKVGSVNLGAIGSAFGISGTLGSILNGVNVGGSGTTGVSVTNATYIADQPKVSLAPRSNGAMSKVFNITGIGKEALASSNRTFPHISNNMAHCKFSVCISYSIDGGNTFDKIVTDFYENSEVISPVQGKGRVNDALRSVFTQKNDALYEPWWMLYFVNNAGGEDHRICGLLFDYQ